jgi:hypothetical protein
MNMFKVINKNKYFYFSNSTAKRKDKGISNELKIPTYVAEITMMLGC